VVADEVRCLAERSQRWIIEIGSMIGEIQRGIAIVMSAFKMHPRRRMPPPGRLNRADTSTSQIERAVTEAVAAI
jgi:methyl-accepting chemotaxis protein